MRIMLDTNVVISGIAFTGNERELLDIIYRKNATLVLSKFVELETRIVLKIKFPGKENIFQKFLSLVPSELIDRPSKERVEEARAIIRNQNDTVVLAAALESKPDIFVSGNLDFHTSEIASIINVMHPKEAIALIDYHYK